MVVLTRHLLIYLAIPIISLTPLSVIAEGDDEVRTIAVWLFDEQQGLYPSKVLHDVSPNENILVLGRSGYIVDGKFGNALKIGIPRKIDFPKSADLQEGLCPISRMKRTGLFEYEIPEGRTVEPMNWQNAKFAALMTSGEDHLRKQVRFPQVTQTGLNLGSVFDWTVEFWYKPTRGTQEDGVIFELGKGPRGENEIVTRLLVKADGSGFTFFNQPGEVLLHIPSDSDALDPKIGEWHHMAFVYNAKNAQLKHYVNGTLQELPKKSVFRVLDRGIEDYFSIGMDGMWGRALPGKLDEMRFSYGKVYTGEFDPPESFSELYLGSPPEYSMKKGPPLLFTEDRLEESFVPLGERKYLFIDDAIVEESENISFAVNPPKIDQMVMRIDGLDEGEPGSWERFRKHLNIVEDEHGLIRLYTALDDDYLGVFLSRDGIHFEAPDLGREHKGRRNIVIPDARVGTGKMILEHEAAEKDRWKYITGYRRRGVYVYTSPDGYSFNRYRQALLPFWYGTQNYVIYDDQRQKFLGYWRTGFARTPAGHTQREFVFSKTNDIIPPMSFSPVSDEAQRQEAKRRRISGTIPQYLDNGPLIPGRFGMDFPTVFSPEDHIDGPSAGIYNPKVIKYPWAPDTYLAFPIFYFHYYEGYPGQQILYFRRGGGPTETQFATSRDGITWKRYTRPVYVGIGRFDDLDVVQTFIAQGMIKRNDEIWQYVFVDSDYHTAHERTRKRQVYRLIQRFDGFVSADAPYERYGTIITRPLQFDGNRLVLNIDTDAHGYALVGLLDENGNPIKGFSIQESVVINGDHIAIEAEWIKRGIERFRENIRDFDGTIDDVEMSGDVSSLEGRTIRVKIKMRGAKLYSMQFVNK